MKNFITRILVVALVSFGAIAFANAQPIDGGLDRLATQVGTADAISLPAGFFGNGSKAFSGTINLVSDPAAGTNYDTEFKRSATTVGGTARLAMTLLRMKSSAPITVSYTNGTTEKWNVTEGLSQTAPSEGSVTFDASGTFKASVKVNPVLTFTKVTTLIDGEPTTKSNGPNKVVLDFGSPVVQAYLQKAGKEAHMRLLYGTGTEEDKQMAELVGLNENSTADLAAQPAAVSISGSGSFKVSGGQLSISNGFALQNPVLRKVHRIIIIIIIRDIPSPVLRKEN